jgi:hypothetical protein
MGRLLRLGVISSGLLLAGGVLALWCGVVEAGPVAAAAGLVLLTLAGLHWRGRRPGFTAAQRRQVFGRWHD